VSVSSGGGQRVAQRSRSRNGRQMRGGSLISVLTDLAFTQPEQRWGNGFLWGGGSARKGGQAKRKIDVKKVLRGQRRQRVRSQRTSLYTRQRNQEAPDVRVSAERREGCRKSAPFGPYQWSSVARWERGVAPTERVWSSAKGRGGESDTGKVSHKSVQKEKTCGFAR